MQVLISKDKTLSESANVLYCLKKHIFKSLVCGGSV